MLKISILPCFILILISLSACLFEGSQSSNPKQLFFYNVLPEKWQKKCYLNSPMAVALEAYNSETLPVAVSPVDPSEYIPPRPDEINNLGKPISIKTENEPVSRYIQSLNRKGETAKVVLVPGFASPESSEAIHETAIQRLALAIKEFNQAELGIILVSGGNVSPKGTPYNEAMEMKKWLLSKGVPEHKIAVEPYAQNTVENLLYAGRFMKAHQIEKATLVTTLAHNLYIGLPWFTSFHLRSWLLKKQRVGRLTLKGCFKTSFSPY